MSPADARRIIAAYLAGRPVSGEQLSAASETLRSDSGHMRFLDEELGGGEWVSGCDLFLSRAAEFCELTAVEREHRMPELSRHVERCPACREVFWNIRPLWTWRAADDIRARASSLRRVLGEQIRIAADAAGRLFELGLGPGAVGPRLVASTAALPGADALSAKQWVLRDDEGGFVIRLSVTARMEDHAAAVVCSFDSGTRGIPPPPVRLEVRDQKTDALFLGGRLADFETEPMLLSEGSWILRLRVADDAGERIWEVPLTIEFGGGPSEDAES